MAGRLYPARRLEGEVLTNELDIIFSVVLLLAAWKGWQRGFVGSLKGIAGSVAALWVAGEVHPAFVGWLKSQWNMEERLLVWLKTELPSMTGTSPVPGSGDDAGVPLILAAVAFLAVFLLARIALSLVGSILSKLLKALPFIGGLERTAGMVLGAVGGLFIIGLSILLLAVLGPWLPFAALREVIDTSLWVRLAAPYTLKWAAQIFG